MPALTAPPRLVIKRADRRHLSDITALLAQLDDEPVLPLKRAEQLYRAMRRHPNYHVYLAWRGGEAVGTFSLLVIPTLMHDGAREALVDGVVTAPHCRGQGIGCRMMEAAMALAARSGCYKLALSSNLKRLDAHRFYRDLGFRQHGISFSVTLTRAPLDPAWRGGAR